jgi:pilus assembly protein CpaB
VTPRRRASLLLGLALLLGALAASDVRGREAALQRDLGPAVRIVVAQRAVPAGRRLDERLLAVRSVPSRYAPRGAFSDPAMLGGLRAARPIPAGTDVVPALLDDGSEASGAPVRPGERVAELVARGSPELVRPGGHVDVLVTRDTADGRGATTLALEDAEVLAAAPAQDPGGRGDGGDGGPRVALSLRVTLRQAVYLAAAQSFARELRVLPRAGGDRRRGAEGLRVDAGLR